MAAARSAKPAQQRHGHDESPKRSGGSAQRAAHSSRKPPLPSSTPTERPILSRVSDRALLGLLAVVSALPYSNTLRNGLVSDDELQVTNNPYIRNFHNLGTIFTTQAASHIPGRPNFYRPLMNVGYLLCHEVFGLRPFGYHLANLLLHAAVVCAVFLLTQRMFQRRNLALAAAALFALHPVHSEAVAWVSASPDLELGLFYTLTFWFFLDVARPAGRFSFAAQFAMSASFLLTILSKEPAVTLPVLATLYEHFYRPDRQETKSLQKIQRYAALWIATAAYLVFRVRVLGGLGSGSRIHHPGAYRTLLSGLALFGHYVWKLLWPLNLRVFCPFHAPVSVFDPRVLAGLTALAAGAALFYYFWCRARPLSFGLLWLLVALAPVLNARWMPVAAFEERYLYLPSLGFCWLAGWAFLRLQDEASVRGVVWRRSLAAATVLAAAFCLLRIVTRNRNWRDDPTLYTHTLAGCPDAYYVRRDLGLVYWDAGDDVAAEREWREALETEPRYAPTLSSLGLMCLRQQNHPQAIEFFNKALELDPANADALLYLGVAYMETHALQLAEPPLCSAVSIYPLNSNARNALGKLYLEEGRVDEAEEQFRQSAQIEPNITAYGNLGLISWRRGDAPRAEQQWRQALRLAPRDPSILNNLGLACTKLQRYSEAVGFFRQAIELQPNDPSPHSNLGIAYSKSGEAGLAESEFRAALSLAPQKYETRNRLGMLYLEGGRVTEAEEEFRQSLKTQANDTGYCGLGEVHWRRGERGAAQEAFQRAIELAPNNSQARFRLGALYLAEGRKVEALREYQAGLKNDPQNKEALAAVANLGR